MIELFEHNKTAYDSAVSMLSDTGKAAIIHPTGTGNPLSVSNCARIIPTKPFAGFPRLNISSKHNLRTWQKYQTALFPKMSGSLPMPS